MRRLIALFMLAMLAMLAIGCSKPESSASGPSKAPEFLSSVPADGATDLVGSDLTLVLSFDVNVKCPSSSVSKIDASGATVNKVSAFDKDVSISLSGLEPGHSYSVIVPEGTVSDYNGGVAGRISVSFTMKEKAQGIHYDLRPSGSLVNPKATREAGNVYRFLLENCGKKTLSGVQSNASNTNDFADFVYSKVGKYPALTGYDFIFLQYSPTPEGWSWVQDYNDISAASEQWRNNGLVSYMWHWSVPDSEAAWKAGLEKGNFEDYNFYCDKTSFDINEALKEGTWQNRFIMKDIEEAAGYLKNLRDAGIPVIWRPLHEAAGNYNLYGANGAWFWWGRGGAETCKKLWRLLYDQFTNVYGLDNLIWVWTVDVTPGCEDQYADWYPGDDVVDIVGADIYENNTDAKTRQFQALVDLTKGRKLVTISECGNIPDPDKCFAAGNAWSWFMVWCTSDENGSLALGNKDWSLNTEKWWKQVMGGDNVVTRDEMPNLR